MSKRRALIVDDELLIRDLLYDYFTEQSWDVSVVENGEAALRALQHEKFDVLLTDLKMPVMDGSELIDRARELKPGMPIVVITGYPSIESAVRSLRQRVSDYLTKPFNVTRLFKAVEEAVNESAPLKS